MENMTFSQAIEAAKSGKKITRGMWDNIGQYLALATGISYTDVTGKQVDIKRGSQGFILVGRNHIQENWAAMQEDMLAEDWKVVE